MSNNHDSEPRGDNDLMTVDDVAEATGEDNFIEVLGASRDIVMNLGRLGIPTSVLQDSLKRHESIQAVATILQLDKDIPTEAPDQSDALQVYVERMREPSLEINFDETFIADMAKAPTDTAKRLRMRDNFSSIVKEIPPYEHDVIRKVQIMITANPFSGASNTTLILSLRNSAFINTLGLYRLAAFKDMVEATNPTNPTSGQQGKRYTPDTSGVGVLWDNSKLRGLLTTELRELDLVVSHSFEGQPVEYDEKGSLVQTEDIQARTIARLQLQTELLKHGIPRYIEHLLQLWESLPPTHLSMSAHKHLGKGGLDELYTIEKKEMDDIPAEVTDERQRELYRSIIQPRPEVTFDMVGGLTAEKQRTIKLVHRAQHADLYTAAGIEPRAVGLLMGPPGCGKTMLAEAAANKMNGLFLSVKVSDIEAMFAGEAEKNIDALFGLVKVLSESRPVTLFIDEIEGIASSRSNEHMMNWERKITTQLLSALIERYANCLILAATNDGSHVDAAISRSGRFSEIIEIPMPDKDGRRSIIDNWMSYFQARATVDIFGDIDVEALVRQSKGMSGADLKTIVENTIADAVEVSIEDDGHIIPITTPQLLDAINRVQNTNILRQKSYI